MVARSVKRPWQSFPAHDPDPVDGSATGRKDQEQDHDQEQENQSSEITATASPLRKVSRGATRSNAFARLKP
jgi:hypothetical protein